MFYELINKKANDWYQSDDCKVRNIISYMEDQNKLRDAQIESIRLYLFFKIYCKNQSLTKLFCEGYFLQNVNIDNLPLTKQFRDFLEENKAARQLYEISLTMEKYKDLKEKIEDNYLSLNFRQIFSDFFHGVTYANYIYSLPMGAGKTFLMAAFIYIDLYFALNEPDNKAFAHNFIIFAPSGLKSSIVPSLKNIKNFDVTWIFPEPMASELKKIIKYEILDEVKTDKRSNRAKNPNVFKIVRHQPYEDMLGLVLLTNAEKVILNRVEIVNEQLQLNFDNSDVVGKIANELREAIGKIPSLSIFIDEVHHTAKEEIKLNKVIEWWRNNQTINQVIGFSGTPYLDKMETFEITSSLSIKNEDISNTIYYYPLTNAIDNFLKKPKIIASSDNNSLNIIKEGLTEFFDRYKDLKYNGITSKVAIYCGSIKNLEENIYPLVAEIVVSLGMNPLEVILKYHGGNKEYVLPKENELEFASLNTSLSKKRIILLVGIGKEGWDCSSLTGVILSQKGDCPTKMVLQTTCRCLRQVERGKKETALIYLNADNEKLLVSQLKKSQHATLQDFQKGTKAKTNKVSRVSRMGKLNIPNIDYYRVKLNYDEEIEEELRVLKKLKKILDRSDVKEDIIVKEIGVTGEVVERNINQVIYGKTITYKEWLLNIIKESFGFVSLEMLKEYDKELRKIYKKITTADQKLNMTYNHSLINSLVREAFYRKRELIVTKEEVWESVSMLSVKDIPRIECGNLDWQYPDGLMIEKILNKDNNVKAKIDLEKLSYEELLKIAKENPEILTEAKREEEALEIRMSDRTFHYLPYVFRKSSFEKRFLEIALSLNRISSSKLEVYYNGDRNISGFRIECYKTENKKLKKVGLYTPDFLIVNRNKNDEIDKILIIETKGKGYSKQQEFIDRRNYVEKEFIKFNNRKYGYNKFDYLYIEDSLTEEEIVRKLNDKIYEFFKEVK